MRGTTQCTREQFHNLIRAFPSRAASSCPSCILFLYRLLGLLGQRRDIIFDIVYLIPVRFDLRTAISLCFLPPSFPSTPFFLLPNFTLDTLGAQSPGAKENKRTAASLLLDSSFFQCPLPSFCLFN